MVAGLLPLALYSIFGKGMEDFGGNGWIFFGIAWNIVGQFVISHWEKYLTGVLFLPWGYDFAQLVSTRNIVNSAQCLENSISQCFICTRIRLHNQNEYCQENSVRVKLFMELQR